MPDTFFITIPGDRDAGIPDGDFSIEDLNIDWADYQADDVPLLREQFRKLITDAFSLLYDGPVVGKFSDEIEGYREDVVRRRYKGTRPSRTVSVNGRLLNARNDLINHSPDGFEWGYEGSGPAQLALAILADFMENDSLALQQYQDFKRDFIAKLDQERGWEITGLQIQKWIQDRAQSGTSGST